MPRWAQCDEEQGKDNGDKNDNRAQSKTRTYRWIWNLLGFVRWIDN